MAEDKSMVMYLVTSKSGSLSDPCRPVAQILRESSGSGLLAKYEVVDIMRAVGIKKNDASRLFNKLLKGKYLRKTSFP